jgi:phosphoribosylglycinamide formyltransferase-1
MASLLKIGVLVSGTGSNLEAILNAIAERRLASKVAIVISNKAGALALDRAKKAGVPTRVIPHGDFPNREAFDAALVGALREAGVDWVVLAGFMRLITRTMLAAFPSRIVNIHPSLLPAFPGVDAQKQAFDYGVKVTGCTVHLVDEGTDTGPIIAQRQVPVLDGDDGETLRLRILKEEHALLVDVIAAIEQGRVEITPTGDSRRARVRTRPA